MEEKQISNNELAKKIDEGFVEVNANIKDIAEGMAFITNNAVTKTDLKGTEERITKRIEILEHRVLTEYSTRLDILEDAMRQVKTKLGIS